MQLYGVVQQIRLLGRNDVVQSYIFNVADWGVPPDSPTVPLFVKVIDGSSKEHAFSREWLDGIRCGAFIGMHGKVSTCVWPRPMDTLCLNVWHIEPLDASECRHSNTRQHTCTHKHMHACTQHTCICIVMSYLLDV